MPLESSLGKLALTTQVEVCFVNSNNFTDEHIAAYCKWLGAEELRRYSRFVRPERRRQFVLGRVLLRQCLGAVLAVSPRGIKLVERPGNAPCCELPHRAEVGLSISHSGPWVACAVSANTALGLDIEHIDPSRNIGELAAQAFDPEHQAWLAAQPESTRVRDFYQLWSQQEARFKLLAPVAYETALYHPAFAAVLCCAQPLTHAPQFQETTLAL